MQDLYGDRSTMPEVLGEIHRRHPATAKLSLYRVTGLERSLDILQYLRQSNTPSGVRKGSARKVTQKRPRQAPVDIWYPLPSLRFGRTRRLIKKDA